MSPRFCVLGIGTTMLIFAPFRPETVGHWGPCFLPESAPFFKTEALKALTLLGLQRPSQHKHGRVPGPFSGTYTYSPNMKQPTPTPSDFTDLVHPSHKGHCPAATQRGIS